ncbi:family 78 glycoside hydrolase catalytic domain [Paenibacillus lentus]|uniref:family 78 glycoside hydrolase catalytic domain n=1 Tax=Paenibacillus lentus TaxID=1338368 RepID=UPI0036595EAC
MTIKIVRLLVEDEENPLAIGTDCPRFSWQLAQNSLDPEWNLLQVAYRIIVADSEPILAEDQGNMWDSGKIESDQSVYVPYRGRTLTSGTAYFYKVQIWCSNQQDGVWSPIGKFDTALADADWNGKWIGRADQQEEELVPASYLRRELNIDKPVLRARLYATALGMYEARLNGERVGDHILAPGWTDYAQRTLYQTYDVTQMLHEGRNAWAIILGTGWYAGNVGMMGTRIYGSNPCCLMQLRVEYQDGTSASFCTDESWRMNEGPIRYSDMIKGESFDSRLEQRGWDRSGFDDSNWTVPDLFQEYPGTLQPQNGPPVRITQTLEPVRSYMTERGTIIFDFGQNMTGWTSLTAIGPAGSKVSVNHAEMLDESGLLYTLNLRKAVQTCHYVLDGESKQTFQPHFTFHGFRYAEVETSSEEVTVLALTGKVIHSDTPPSGELHTSDELVNQLISNIKWGQRSNFLSVPMDCPQRDERLGWTGDAQIFIRTASYNMNVAGFFRKYMVDIIDAQSPEGAFPDVAPDAGWRIYKGISNAKWFAPDNAGWGDAGVIIPWTVYLMYGDLDILSDCYASMQRWVEYLEKNSEGLLRADYADHADWLSIGADTPKDVLATAYFGYSVSLLARIARVLGKDEDEQAYLALFKRICDAFMGAYVSSDGRIKGDTQTVYVLAIHFDLLAPAIKPQAINRLEQLIVNNGCRLSTGFLGVGYLLPVLSQNGLNDLAYQLLQQEEFPSWLYSVKHGATTIWERWDGWTEEKGFQSPSMNSFNHYSLGSVGEWLYRYAAGIEPDSFEPGFKKIRIKPYPGGGLTHINGSYECPYGIITVDWVRENNRFSMKVSLPVNTTAELCIPGSVTHTVGPAKYVGSKEGRSVYTAGSGHYYFESELITEEARSQGKLQEVADEHE